MKKTSIIQNVFLALVALLAVFSCQDREVSTIDSSAAAIIMDLSKETLFLDKNFPDNPALNVTWNVAEYTQPTEIKYKVEASATSDFAKTETVRTINGSERTATFTVSEMNRVAQTLGLAADKASTLYFRVVSSIGEGGAYLPAVSNVTSLKITPYKLVYPSFYIVGDATAVGWNEKAAQVLYKSENMSYIYTYLKNGNSFRFLGQQDWNPINYSVDLAGTKDAYRYFKQISSNLAQNGDENMKFSGADGIYKVAINAASGVKSLQVTASPVAAFDVPVLFLVGSITGWSADQAIAMTRVSEGVFTVTTILKDDAEFKFLGQKSFGDLEWGNILKDNNGNSGFLAPKGDNGNIKFAGAGATYKITVNIKFGTYTIEKQ